MILCSCNLITVDQFLTAYKQLKEIDDIVTPQHVISKLGYAYVCGSCAPLQLSICKKQQRGQQGRHN